MQIYPIGTISAASSAGTVDGISYSMFEPNAGCNSQVSYNILNHVNEKVFLMSRKKAEASMTMTYKYNNIFDKEYRQIEHFLDNVDESLTSFFAVDFSKGLTPSSIVNSSGDWLVYLSNTRLFSSTTNLKSHQAFIYDGSNWKLGDINTVTTNTSILVDVDENNYGALTLTNAQSKGIVYPIYEVYTNPGSITSFESTIFIKKTINKDNIGGWMRSGTISFICKYKV